MLNVKDIMEKLEKAFPPENAEDWDNCGLLVNLGNTECQKVLTTLTVTEKCIDYAIKNGCDFIVSHHPVIFEPLKKIDDKVLIKSVQNGIQVYCAHTNIDKAPNGTTATLIEKCGFQEFEKISDFTFGVNCGKIRLNDFITLLKHVSDIETVRITNPVPVFDKIAFCAGSGTSEAQNVLNAGYNVFVTGDVTYHKALDAEKKGLTIIDIGHCASEKFVPEIIENVLGFECEKYRENTPWTEL